MKKVMVFGAFDGLHSGHLHFFRQAKKYGDTLLVSVGTDKNVEKIKGKKPVLSEKERVDLISQLKIVDSVILGAETDYFLHIKKHMPDVICLGYDQWAQEGNVRKGLDDIGLTKTEIYRLESYEPTRAKSTILKKKSAEFSKL
jgi:cytidyltransferase-like protein